MSNLDIKFKRLTPFKRCVLQNFPFIEADFDALTNYGLLCKIVEYLNKVIASQNEVQGVTEEIVTAFNNLYDYFENLDVQEEIDNKLDQMAEDGTLAELINNQVLAEVIKSAVEVDTFQTAYFGNSICLKFKYQGQIKTAIVDFYDDPSHYVSTNYDLLVNKMVAKDYSKFDYAFVTHYHLDHVGCLPSFLDDNRLDFSKCVFYLPPTPDYSLFTNPDYIPAKEEEIISLLESKNIEYHKATNQTLTINEETSIRLLNADTDAFTNYYNVIRDGKTNYNNFSMVIEVQHVNNIITCTGDVEGAAQEVIVDSQGLRKPTVLVIPHHGVTGPVGSYLPFIQRYKGQINLVDKNDIIGFQGIYNVYPLLYMTGVSGDINVKSNGVACQAIAPNGCIKYETTTTQRDLAENYATDTYELAPTSSSLFKITANSDLNDFTQYGTYGCDTAQICSTLANKPNHYDTAFKLYVNQLSSFGRLEQTIVYGNVQDPKNSSIYKRYGLIGDDSAWGEWECDLTAGAGNQLKNGDDLNDITIGNYSSPSGSVSSNVSNTPAGVTTAFRMFAFQTSGVSDRYTQMLIPQANPAKIFIRQKTGDGWQSWYSFTGTLVS